MADQVPEPEGRRIVAAERLRIAIVVDSLIRGGAERQACYTASGLAAAGHEVELIYYRRAEFEYDMRSAGKLRVTYLPRNRSSGHFLWRLRRLLRHGRFDVMHAFKDTPSVYGCIAAWSAGIPVRLAGYRAQYQSRGWIHAAMHIVDRLASGWIVNSRAVRASIAASLGVNGDCIDVVYNGFDATAFQTEVDRTAARSRLGLSEGQPVVTIIGRLRPEKNHRMFLDMCVRVLQSRGESVFLIVGDGELRTELEQYAARIGASGSVRFLNGRSDIAEILRATDVYVLTSRTEGLANSVIEAMHAGVPVVCTRYPGVEELLEDGVDGLITPQDAPAESAAAVLRLLDDADLRLRLGRAGRMRVERQFGMDAMISATLAIYRSHLERSRRWRSTATNVAMPA